MRTQVVHGLQIVLIFCWYFLPVHMKNDKLVVPTVLGFLPEHRFPLRGSFDGVVWDKHVEKGSVTIFVKMKVVQAKCRICQTRIRIF